MKTAIDKFRHGVSQARASPWTFTIGEILWIELNLFATPNEQAAVLNLQLSWGNRENNIYYVSYIYIQDVDWQTRRLHRP
jgi:hypothetical protein